MLGLVLGLLRARTARPLLCWVLGVLVYVIAPLPQEWVLLLIVGLGVALAMTVARLRERGREAGEHITRAWGIAERLTGAVEDRIRGGYEQPAPPPYMGQAPYAPAIGQGGAYDPGALLSALAAVLAAEGLPVNAGAALPAVVQLLAWQGISAQPGVPAPTALTLATSLRPAGQQRTQRAMPAGLLASVIRAIQTSDGVLPAQITTDDADTLIDGSAHILQALGIVPDDTAGPLQAWPVMAELLTAAPLPPPADPPPTPYGYYR